MYNIVTMLFYLSLIYIYIYIYIYINKTNPSKQNPKHNPPKHNPQNNPTEKKTKLTLHRTQPIRLFLVLRGKILWWGPRLIFVWSKFKFQAEYTVFFFSIGSAGGAISAPSPNVGPSVLLVYIASSQFI